MSTPRVGSAAMTSGEPCASSRAGGAQILLQRGRIRRLDRFHLDAEIFGRLVQPVHHLRKERVDADLLRQHERDPLLRAFRSAARVVRSRIRSAASVRAGRAVLPVVSSAAGRQQRDDQHGQQHEHGCSSHGVVSLHSCPYLFGLILSIYCAFVNVRK